MRVEADIMSLCRIRFHFLGFAMVSFLNFKSKRNSLIRCLLGLLASLLNSNSDSVHAQQAAVRRFPAEGYYLSLVKVGEGRLEEAQHGFETAYQAARRVGDQHGIDSVPSLIRIGQSLCLQGDLAEGLKQLEAGLLLAKRCRSWTRFLQAQTISNRGLSNEMRGIQWFKSQRKTELGVFPESWPVSIGLGTILVEAAAGEAPGSTDVIRMDAIEIYLAQATALRLRYRLLGSMASAFPVSKEILEIYLPPRVEYPEVLRRCHNICHALALIGMGDTKSATQLLQSNLEVSGGWDHPLTGVALLALADLAIQSDDRQASLNLISESTLIFARLGQHDWLAEAVGMLASVSSVRRYPAGLEMLNSMATWLQSRSYLSHTATLAASAGLAAELENYPLAETRANQALKKTGKTVGPIPHFQVNARYALARAMIKQGKVDVGRTALESLLKSAQGDDLPGPLSRQLFQLEWLDALLDANQISAPVAAEIYDTLLDGPSKIDWLYEPWESLGAATADTSESGFRWLAMVARQADEEATIQAFERLNRIQCRFYLPFAGRELNLRILFHSESFKNSEEATSQMLILRKDFPAIDQNANMIQRQIAAARNVKSIDAKAWTQDERNLWTQLAQQCEQQEQRLLEASCSRTTIPNVFPPITTLDEVRSVIELQSDVKGAAILGFFVASHSTYGYLITKEHTDVWGVDRAILAKEKHTQLLEAIGVGQTPTKILATLKKPAWQSVAKELRDLLIPTEAQKQLSQSTSLTIVPHDWIWYVPFEIFNDNTKTVSQPWIARLAISYAPTLGIAVQNFAETRSPSRTLGVSKGGFFVAEKEIDDLLTKGIVESVSGTQHVDLQNKVHASQWSRLQFDQVWVAADTKLEYGTPFALMAYDAGGGTSLKQWLQLPLSAPTQLILIGSEVPAMAKNEGEGIELFRLSCCLAAMGNRSALVNRWCTRGESSQLLVKNFLELSSQLSAVQAWRRSVLMLWETPLQYATEPILGTLKKDFYQEVFNGSHPIFWSGTIPLGNTHPITK